MNKKMMSAVKVVFGYWSKMEAKKNAIGKLQTELDEVQREGQAKLIVIAKGLFKDMVAQEKAAEKERKRWAAEDKRIRAANAKTDRINNRNERLAKKDLNTRFPLVS